MAVSRAVAALGQAARTLGEPLLAGVAGAAIGAGTAAPLGVVWFGAGIGGLNGVVSGWTRSYDWRSRSGPLAFTLDSSWALLTTGSGLVAHLIAAVTRRGRYIAELSERQNRHVYAAGFQPRRGFAITLGNVVNGAGDTGRPRRAKLITDHEDVHIWQARWFGPTYPLLYAGWMASAAVIGACAWALRYRHLRFSLVVESFAYYANPFEWWAYSRDDYWPPSGKAPDVGWRRPAVRSFTARSAARTTRTSNETVESPGRAADR